MSNLAHLIQSRSEHQQLFEAAGRLAKERGVRVFLVGGAVRDLLMGRDAPDIDIMVEDDGVDFAAALAKRLGAGRIVAYTDFGTALIPLYDVQVEVATARTETYHPDSRKPEITPGTIESDLPRRDFTVNALALSIHPESFGQLWDPFHGIRDLERRILRTPVDPDTTFSDDPLRMMRAARFAAQLEFAVDPAVLQSMHRQKDRISIVSWERITGEIMKLLSARKPSIGLSILKDAGLLKFVFPELDGMSGIEMIKGRGHKDVFAHTLQVVDHTAKLSSKPELCLAALVHDIGKPRTKRFDQSKGWTFYHHEEVGRQMIAKVARRMKLPGALRDYLMKLTRLHLRPIALAQSGITDSAVRRLMREAGDDVDDLMILCRADVTTKREARIARYMANFERVEALMADVTVRDEMRAFQSPVRGAEIMEICNLEPGPAVGRLKSAIEEAILEGEIENTHAAALEYLLKTKDAILSE